MTTTKKRGKKISISPLVIDRTNEKCRKVSQLGFAQARQSRKVEQLSLRMKAMIHQKNGMRTTHIFSETFL